MNPITYNSQNVSKETLLELHKNLMLPRMIEEKMLVYLRQGKISKWLTVGTFIIFQKTKKSSIVINSASTKKGR